MKLNLITKLLLLFTALLLVSQTGFCDTGAAAVDTNQSELIVMMIKFGKVMFGVLIASFVIYVILYVWNIIVKRSGKHPVTDLSLKTPQNTDDAILFFINKNKLK